MSPRSKSSRSNTARTLVTAAFGLLASSMLTGCLLGGYGNDSGDLMLPGGIGLIFVLALLLWFLLRRR